MSDQPRPKRAYNSSRRQAQARQTRQQISDAAFRLFGVHGYAGTTIEAIAREAGVAPETVYSIFGSKHKILWHLMNISVGGDDEPVTILDRSGPQAVFQETDQRRQLQMFAEGISAILERATPVQEMMRSAAEIEPEIADLLRRTTQERWDNMSTVVRRVQANGPLRGGLEGDRAVAAVWTLTSAQVFLLLTRDRGWSTAQFASWLADSLIRLLLP